jgi:hypothetical protein
MSWVRVKEVYGNLMQGGQGESSVHDARRSIILFRDKMGVCADERGTDQVSQLVTDARGNVCCRVTRCRRVGAVAQCAAEPR